jgi:hypothetical protein
MKENDLTMEMNLTSDVPQIEFVVHAPEKKAEEGTQNAFLFFF